MYRASLRSSPARVARALRPSGASGVNSSSSSSSSSCGASARRLLGTAAAPAAKNGSWKGTAVRWGLAAGALYWYNTSPIFADESARVAIAEPSPEDTAADLQTIDALLELKQKHELERAQAAAAAAATAAEKEQAADAPASAETAPAGAAAATGAAAGGESAAAAGSPEALEEEAGQQGAFNPETGEINWDCPCLGGMAHGPCGEDFKAAFSCFVYSTEEPKGMDCIDKFQHMQDCFRQYPEIYGAELDEDEAAADAAAEGAEPSPVEDGAAAAAAAASVQAPETAAPTTEEAPAKAASTKAAPAKAAAAPTPAPAAAEKFPEFESDKAVPKQAWDATEANTGVKA